MKLKLPGGYSANLYHIQCDRQQNIAMHRIEFGKIDKTRLDQWRPIKRKVDTRETAAKPVLLR
jgi:hypothetical protein